MAMCRMILAYNLTSIRLTDGDVKTRFRRVGNIALLAVNLLNGLAFHIVVKPNLFFFKLHRDFFTSQSVADLDNKSTSHVRVIMGRTG